jgi:hypothetical protein
MTKSSIASSTNPTDGLCAGMTSWYTAEQASEHHRRVGIHTQLVFPEQAVDGAGFTIPWVSRKKMTEKHRPGRSCRQSCGVCDEHM